MARLGPSAFPIEVIDTNSFFCVTIPMDIKTVSFENAYDLVSNLDHAFSLIVS